MLAEALNLVHQTLTDYIVFPSDEAADALTLWIAATHCQDRWEHATRFILKSPVKRCGKSRAQEITSGLVHNPLIAGSISAAALVRTITASDPPTVVLDEADAIFNGKSADEAAEALRNVLNNGFARNRPYLRWDTRKREVERCPTFAMACIAAIGDLPDTIEDRAVVVVMQRRAPGERVVPYRQRNADDLRHTRTTLEHALKLSDLNQFDSYTIPEMPVEDRAADVWEPLVVIAESASGDWPERARRACVALAGADEGELSMGVRLLSDLNQIWGEDEQNLATRTILDRLQKIDDAPWGDYYGRPLNARDLARLLRLYDVRPTTVDTGEVNPKSGDRKKAKGYKRDDLHAPWERYTHTPESPLPALQALPPEERVTQGNALTREVTEVTEVTPFQGMAHENRSNNPSDRYPNDLSQVTGKPVEAPF